MHLNQIVRPGCIKVPLLGRDKASVIQELIELLEANRLVTDKKLALDAVMMRERTRSTGIGSGIAIPHGKCKAVKELVMAIGLAKEPIEFDSVDGKPVRMVMLLVSPTDQTGPHIQALAKISRLMLDDGFRQSFEQAQNADDAYRLLQEKESE